MSEFKREYRYQVIKLSDLERTPLSSEQKSALLEVIQAVHNQRVSDGKGCLECVVVESDWPEYEPTWKAIEKRMSAPLSDQPDTRPGTPLMLTMETLDLWHQIIHDDSLERGDRLQRIAARINVIQDSVKRAADQVKQSIDTPSMYELMDYPAPVDDSVYSEKGWLIEIGESSYNDLRYQTMINGVRAWTESSEDALRFCRRQDAEKFAAASSLKCRIAEHVWHGKAADQVADQPADAVVVPLDLIKRIDDALGAFTGDEELLNSHIDTYNDVREIRAAQEGK